MRRVGIYGWGIVAPQCANVGEFEQRLAEGGSWLSPFEGFGPSNFLVGAPKFDFSAYRRWLEKRFPPNRFRQLVDKMDQTTLFAIGAFIQAVESNPKLEAALADPDAVPQRRSDQARHRRDKDDAGRDLRGDCRQVG